MEICKNIFERMYVLHQCINLSDGKRNYFNLVVKRVFGIVLCMTRARNEIVDPAVTPYYHCISRCVRRAYLCGFDQLTQKNFDHRKTWIVNRLALLSHTFALEVCAYAVMSNHMHCLVRLNLQQAQAWSEYEVVVRWNKLYSIPTLVQQYQKGECNQAEARQARQTIEVWRDRLASLSWFMRCLNEYIARLANQEDECTGKFWEGRFKSQALLDEAAVLTCMSYIDLNPIRAGEADQLETSNYTSIQQRLYEYANKQVNTSIEQQSNKILQPSPMLLKVKLMPLVELDQDSHHNSLGFTARDYLELVDWAGRGVREDKSGSIAQESSPILERLALDAETFILHMAGKHGKALIESPIALGVLKRLKQFAQRLGTKFVRYQGIAPGLYRMT